MPDGRLQIGTFLVDAGLPAEFATVRITQHGDPSAVVEEIVTDESGQSPEVTLPAPSLDLSLEPQREEIPYSEYDVYVSTSGYQTTIMEGVQIFPDITAIQDVSLIPLAPQVQAGRNILIDDNTLWGNFPPKIPEEEVKPLPESLGLVVLPNPVIPEFIIVHDGVPDDVSAPNYYIPYKSYIKNVASCEIYSTWPTTTIEANILAIISFTLNRVYTEWYRGKGYNFTITSSTAYDHAFSYNRNIYDSISRVVDNLFSTFVTRPNIRQPLLTQYCDGVQSLCPDWMTQWGSKSLGDQGYDAVRILRSFYGQDIFLMGADRVAGVPSSYPGYNLQVGSTGPAVRTIQEQLNAIANNYPAINKMPVDGVFGERTRLAVETFQSVFHLPASGIVDFPTWYKISDIYVSVTRIAELR